MKPSHLLALIALLFPQLSAAQDNAPRYTFPKDPSVLDAKRDGKTDDTDALQRAIEASGFGLHPL